MNIEGKLNQIRLHTAVDKVLKHQAAMIGQESRPVVDVEEAARDGYLHEVGAMSLHDPFGHLLGIEQAQDRWELHLGMLAEASVGHIGKDGGGSNL